MPAFAGPVCVVPPHAVETASGLYVDVVAPDPQTISVHDIAWSLARQARFAGHTISDEVWNVAQHCLFVTDLVDAAVNDPEDNCNVKTSLRQWLYDKNLLNEYEKDGVYVPSVKMYALMHDATEAYLIDLPSPVKRHEALREPYKHLEAGLNSAVLKALNLPEPDPVQHEIVVWADLMALQIEAGVLMPSRGRGWNGSLPNCDATHLHLFPMQVKPWRLAYDAFMLEFKMIAQDL